MLWEKELCNTVFSLFTDFKAFFLTDPVERVGSTFTPVGFNPILEKEILPDEAKIYEAAKNLLEY